MRIAILGIGNVLMGDDGFGPYVIRALESRFTYPRNVTVADLGTPGLDLIPFLIETEAVVFVDTVRAAGAPGDLRVYHINEILRHAPALRVSPHDPGVKRALLSLRLAGLGPTDATLVGAIPASVTATPGLSTALARTVPDAIDAIVSELARLGTRMRPRKRAPLATPWWEACPTA